MNAPTIALNFVEPARILAPLLNISKNKEEAVPRRKILYTNEAIIHGLKSRDKDVINYIYKQSYAQVRFFVTSNNGDTMDAEDVFQDTIVLIYKNIDSAHFSLTCSFSTYLFSICRHLWLQKLNRKMKNTSIEDYMATSEPEEEFEQMQDHLVDSEKFRLFQKYFNKLNNSEQKILNLYMNKTHGKEIAKIMGYKSDKYAKYRKYVVKEKLKNMIINDEQFKEVYRMSI
jgi:RNA polymerase sigma factor (sigma-70 family)